MNSDTTLVEKDLIYIEQTLNAPLMVFASQFINPTPYPHVGEMSSNEKEIINRQNQKIITEHFINICNTLNVKYAIPYAGPALIIDRDFKKEFDVNYLEKEIDAGFPKQVLSENINDGKIMISNREMS